MICKNSKILIYFLIFILLLSCTTTVTKDNSKVYKKKKQFTYKKDNKKDTSKNKISKEKYTKKKLFKNSNIAFFKSINDIGRTIQKFTKITIDQINKFFAVIYKYFQKQFIGFSKTKFYKMLNEKWDE